MITYKELGRMGRLGNQMFQIAAAVALAARYQDHAEFYGWDFQSFFKRGININPNINIGHAEFREPKFGYTPIPYWGGMSLYGYFQSEKYFMDQEAFIRKTFEFVDDLVSTEHLELAKESCSIHVRRTDYLEPDKVDIHQFPGDEYYRNAIDFMEGYGVKKFMVFSDDMKWCMDTFGEDTKFNYINGYREVKDMCLMSHCQHHIIANSSFSWWGAWLNANKNKKVIAPAKWFGDGFKDNWQDIYCEGWIKI